MRYRLPTFVLFFGLVALQVCSAQQQTMSFEKLLQTLDASSEADRIRAIARIAEHGDEATKAIPALVDLLDDSSPDTRAAAIIALDHIGSDDEVVLAGILSRLEDEAKRWDDVPVWAFAARALGQLGPKSVPRLIEKLSAESRTGRRAAAVALHDITPPPTEALPALVTMLKENEPTTRIAAMYAILKLGPRKAIPAMDSMQKMLDAEDFHTQYWACRMMGAIGSPEALVTVPKLIELTSTGAASVRSNAARAIGNIGPSVGGAVVEPLTKLIEDRSHPVRQEGLIALGRLGELSADSAPAIRDAMSNKSLSVRAECAGSLWQITGESKESLPVLLEVIQEKSGPWEASHAFERLGALGKPALPELVKLIETGNAETQYFAALAVIGIGPAAKESIPRLQQLLETQDEDLRELVKETIEHINSL